jgi:hypothetical protein
MTFHPNLFANVKASGVNSRNVMYIGRMSSSGGLYINNAPSMRACMGAAK